MENPIESVELDQGLQDLLAGVTNDVRLGRYQVAAARVSVLEKSLGQTMSVEQMARVALELDELGVPHGLHAQLGFLGRA